MKQKPRFVELAEALEEGEYAADAVPHGTGFTLKIVGAGEGEIWTLAHFYDDGDVIFTNTCPLFKGKIGRLADDEYVTNFGVIPPCE